MATITQSPSEGDSQALTPLSDSQFIDLGAAWRAFKRRFVLFALVAAVVAALVIVGYFLMTPRYTATSQVQISTSQAKVVDTEQVVSSKLPDTYVVDTKVEVLKSRTLARDVVRQLKLYDRTEFVGPELSALPTTPENLERKMGAAVGNLLANLKVARSGLAYVIDITYQSPSSATAAEVANTVAERFVASDLDSKQRATAQATQWLQKRLADLRGQVLTAETAVQQYRQANNLLSKEAEDPAAIQALSQMNTELASARADAAEKAARARTGNSDATGNQSGQSSTLLADLRGQQARLTGTIADLRTRYGDRHPDLQRALSQEADIEAQIGRETRRIRSELASQASAANARVGSLSGSLGQSRGSIVAQNAAQVRLAELERNAEAVRVLYQTYLNRYRETSSQAGLEASDSVVLTYSSEPSLPSAPNLFLFLAIAVIGGAAGGAAAVAFAEMIDRGVHSSTQVRDKLGMRTLAIVPSFKTALSPQERKQYRSYSPDFLVERPFSAFSESFRMLRSSLVNPKSATKVVAITSALPKEGKSTTAAALTRMAGIDGMKAVLIECDTRRGGTMDQRRGIDAGILELLAGEATLEQVLRHDEASNAYLIPISAAHSTRHHLLVSDAFDALLVDLRQRFDLIVLDTPPVLPIAESRVLCAKADSVAYLVRWGTTNADASEAGLRLLQDVGARVKGVVLTQANLNAQRNWSTSDASSYHQLYKDYYA